SPQQRNELLDRTVPKEPHMNQVDIERQGQGRENNPKQEGAATHKFSERVDPCPSSAQRAPSTIPQPITHEFTNRSAQCRHSGYLKNPQTGKARRDSDHEQQVRYREEWDHVAYYAHQKDNEDRVPSNQNHDCVYYVEGHSWLSSSTAQK